jgi:hypothetical protein
MPVDLRNGADCRAADVLLNDPVPRTIRLGESYMKVI